MKWEYTFLVTEKPLVQELNNMGVEGWELVQILDEGKVAVFKRPLEK